MIEGQEVKATFCNMRFYFVFMTSLLLFPFYVSFTFSYHLSWFALYPGEEQASIPEQSGPLMVLPMKGCS